jgi:predicted N-formylglutamate amidohydrolase
VARSATGPRRIRLLLSCEHGGNTVPAAYRALFRGHGRLLDSHRGLDIGARFAARYLQSRLKVPLICATVTRLLVDLNRSVGHAGLFSELTRELPQAYRQALLERHYHPYRNRVANWIAARLAAGDQVLHVSVHSFTPTSGGRRRPCDVGLLYDPGRPEEARLCAEWQAALRGCAPRWRVRRNYPYRGTSDGQVVALRRRFDPARYSGIELEINQACLARADNRARLLADLAATFPA